MKEDGLTGGRRWERVGQSVYRKGDVYVWREGRAWWRCVLPPQSFRWALHSVCMSPFGIWQKNSGPFPTMAKARRG